MTRLLVDPREGPDAGKMNHSPGMNQIEKSHLPRNLKLAEERAQRRLLKRRPRPKGQRKMTAMMRSYPIYHFENTRNGRDRLIPV